MSSTSAPQVSCLFKQSIEHTRFKRTRRLFLRFLKRNVSSSINSSMNSSSATTHEDTIHYQDVMQFLNECIKEYFKLAEQSGSKLAYYTLYGTLIVLPESIDKNRRFKSKISKKKKKFKSIE
jgi:hypothetical protein